MTNSSQKPFILPNPIYKYGTEEYTIVISEYLENRLLRGDQEAMHEVIKFMKKHARRCNRSGIIERWKLRTQLRLERDLNNSTSNGYKNAVDKTNRKM